MRKKYYEAQMRYFAKFDDEPLIRRYIRFLIWNISAAALLILVPIGWSKAIEKIDEQLDKRDKKHTPDPHFPTSMNY